MRQICGIACGVESVHFHYIMGYEHFCFKICCCVFQYLELARTLKYYGFLQFRPCLCDYPRPESQVLVSAGNRELNLRVRLAEGQDMKEGSFKVTRMRCWRITTLHNVSKGYVLFLCDSRRRFVNFNLLPLCFFFSTVSLSVEFN